MHGTAVLEPGTIGLPEAPTASRGMDVEFGRGVTELVAALGEGAMTVEMTLDFDNLVAKHAVVFPGASQASLGFRCLRVDNVDVWWRQRLLLANGDLRLSSTVRPRRVVISRVGRALSATLDYA